MVSLSSACGALVGGVSGSSPAEGSVERGELYGLIRAEAPRLMADVAWLADDTRLGRRSGTLGEDAARDFIVKRMQTLGLNPIGENGYLQSFDVALPARDGGGSSFVLTTVAGDFRLSAPDIVPLFCSASGEAAGSFAWVGFGIVDPEASRDDFSRIDVAGKLVLIARGAPPFPASKKSDGKVGSYGGPRTSFGSAASIFTKVMNAKHRGAAGVLLVQSPDKADTPLLEFDAAQAAQAGIPALMISVDLADRILGASYASDLEHSGQGLGLQAQPQGRGAIKADVVRTIGKADNVLGRLAGKDRSRSVVVGAHYDHLGLGGTGSLSSKSIGQIHNGADDNASGTAATLELARLMVREAEVGILPDCDVIFAFWSGEELGLLGSDYWCTNPTLLGGFDAVVANLNFDMVGRADSGRLQVMGAGSSKLITRWLGEAASRSGLDPTVTLSGHGIGGSDHQSFLTRGVPAVHLFTGVHTDYHKPSDDVDRFESDGAHRVVEYGRFLLAKMCAATELPFEKIQLAEDDDRPSRDRSWSAWFGSIPDYAPSSSGLLLAGVQEGSPAERAGLLGGDRLIVSGGVEIATIHDFVYSLQLHKPGDVIRVRYIRKGIEGEVILTLGSRELE